MDYDSIDIAARAKALALVTGHGDLSALTTGDALSAERSAVVLELRHALLAAHAASADPDAAQFAVARDAILPGATQARDAATRIVTATGVLPAEVNALRAGIIAANLAKAEADHFDADWKLTNLPDETPEETAALSVVRDRAAREIAVLKGL